MSALSYVLLAYVLVNISALAVIGSMDTADRKKNHSALLLAQEEFEKLRVVADERPSELLRRMDFLPFPIRSYAEDSSARLWLNTAIELLNARRQKQHSSNRQDE